MPKLIKSFLRLCGFGFGFAVAMALALVLYCASILPTLPSVEEIRKVPLDIPLKIYTADEKLIAEYGNERRIPLTLDDTPNLLIASILASEDDKFYYHTGVDFMGLARALVSNFLSGSKGQGASTVTMQVARNFFLDRSKTYTRKLKEILLAFNIERALTKDEILELYINKIFLGHRAYGFAAASRVYYGNDLNNLSIPEIAMLAGLPKAPSRGNPLTNPNRAKTRRNYVLTRLHELGKLDLFSYETAINAPITARKHVADVDIKAPYVAEMARQLVYSKLGESVYQKGLKVVLTVNSQYQEKAVQSLRKGLLDYDKRHGFRQTLGYIDLNKLDPTKDQKTKLVEILHAYADSGKLVPAVVTMIKPEHILALNKFGEEINIAFKDMKWARNYITANSLGVKLASPAERLKHGDIVYLEKKNDQHWLFSQLPEVSGALVSIDSHSGAILALTGGFDYYLSKFNRAVQAERQPGSNIKPFIYATALANGYTPASFVSAAPIVVEDDLEGIWRPQNYSKKFFGPTRLRKALALSLNLVSVRLLRSIGIQTTIDHISKFGFDPEKLPRSLSLALGSTALTPLELIKGYAMISNGGKKVEPHLIARIEDAQGHILDFDSLICHSCVETENSDNLEPQIEAIQTHNATQPIQQQDLETQDNAIQSLQQEALTPQNAFLIKEMLKQVILTGTGRRALALNRTDLGGKTGTTSDYKDAWFSGFSTDVTTTVFVGFDEPKHLGRRESGAGAALPIWIDFMDTILKDYPEKPTTIPPGIVTRFINKETGKLTYESDPDGFSEYFLQGTEPTNIIPTAPTEGQQVQPKEPFVESLF